MSIITSNPSLTYKTISCSFDYGSAYNKNTEIKYAPLGQDGSISCHPISRKRLINMTQANA